MHSYFNLSSLNFATPPLFYLALAAPASEPEDGQTVAWRRSIPDDRANTESSSPAASPYMPGLLAKGHISQLNSPSVFGVDPPRPAREGFE
jgi:hypothetical protein